MAVARAVAVVVAVSEARAAARVVTRAVATVVTVAVVMPIARGLAHEGRPRPREPEGGRWGRAERRRELAHGHTDNWVSL